MLAAGHSRAFRRVQQFLILFGLSLVALAACRGSGVIGPAGGTVTGPAGAQVVVPAGALRRATVISVTQSSSGAPALPTTVTAVGQMFAFTPHGTSFASPATVTVPFDPALVPAGAAVTLYKTNAAQSAWEIVANAAVSGSTISGQVSSFSFFVAGYPPLASSDPFPPHKIWEFHAHYANDQELRIDQGEAFGDVVFDQVDFGPLVVAPAGHDLTARGEVFSNASGKTYWVEAEAPIGDLSNPGDVVGGETRLWQRQFFRKRTADATLRYVVTQAWIDAIDNNGTQPVLSKCPWAQDTGLVELCLDEVLGELDLTITLVTYEGGGSQQELRAAHRGIARFWGWQNDWRWDVQAGAVAHVRGYRDSSTAIRTIRTTPIFNEDQFDFFVNDQGSVPATTAGMRLREPVVVEIDLSQIEACVPTTNPEFPCVGGTFYIETTATALAHNRRGRESFVNVRLRDPASSDGLDWQTTGVDEIAPVELTGSIIEPEPECTGAGASSESGMLQFSEPTYALPEFRHSSRTVLVTRTGGSVGEVIARVTTSDGTAIGGTHYEPVAQTIVFGDGDAVPRAVTIPIVNDTTFGGANTINLNLAAVGACANIGGQSTAVVTILDDETPPPATYTVGGAVTGLAGTGLVLQEVRTGREVAPAGDGPFTFDYQFQNGSSYEVRVLTQPTNPIQSCTVTNPTGTISSSNVTTVAVSCITPQASGSLDTTFGQDGRVTADLASSAGARALALQSDGRILAVGGMQLLRFNADGSVDTTFGSGGIAPVVFNGSSLDQALDVAVQGDGRILVVGHTRVGTQDDFAIARFNADGSPDTSFGTLGRTSVPVYEDADLPPPTSGRIVGGADRAYKVLPLDGGDILVAGHGGFSTYDSRGVLIGNSNSYAVVRLNADGSVDTSFNVTGRATQSPNGVDAALAYAAAVQADGRILVGGRHANPTTESDLGLVRFNADGSLDTTFGPSDFGYVIRDLYGYSDEVRDLLVLPDGRIVLAARVVAPALPAPVAQFTIVSFTADGGLLGFRSTPIGAGGENSDSIAIQPDGRFVLAGAARDAAGANVNFGLVRYNDDLTVDTTFGTNGVVTVDFFGSTDTALDVLIQPDGRIVVGGVVRNGSSWDLGITRVVP